MSNPADIVIGSSDACSPDAPSGLARLLGRWGPPVILLMLATLPYVGVLRNDFAYVYDDKAQIIDNPYVHTFGHLKQALTTPVWSFRDSNQLTHYYRPVMTIGFLLTYRLFGPLPFGFHLISLLLHAGVVIILFFFARQFFRDRAVALAAAGLFALHPIHVESIAWVSGVTDLELTLFYVLAFWGFLQSGEARRGRFLAGQAVMLTSFSLALLSKEQALTLPFLAVIFEHYYRGDRTETSQLRKMARYGGLWLVALAYVLVRILVLGSITQAAGMHHLSFGETIASGLGLLAQYLAKLVWPAHLTAFYVFHPSQKLLEPAVLAGIASLVACVMILGLARQGGRPASFGIVWLLGTLSPVLNAGWMGPYVLAERYLYLPSVGYCLFAGWLATTVWRKLETRRRIHLVVAAGAGVVTVLCIARIVTCVPVWHDDVTLFRHAIAVEPGEYILHDALGDAYWLRGSEQPAEYQWKEALRINSAFPRPLNALGALYAKQRRFDEAAGYLERAISMTPNDADARMNLGAVYAESGRLDRAEEQFRAGISMAPRNFSGHNILGKLFFDSGRLNAAEEQFRQSLECDPNLAAWDYLGYIYERRGDNAGAEKAFRAALTLNSGDSHAHYHLGQMFAASGRLDQARQELNAARSADPNNPQILSALEKLGE